MDATDIAKLVPQLEMALKIMVSTIAVAGILFSIWILIINGTGGRRR